MPHLNERFLIRFIRRAGALSNLMDVGIAACVVTRAKPSTSRAPTPASQPTQPGTVKYLTSIKPSVTSIVVFLWWHLSFRVELVLGGIAIRRSVG
jgi:hypothetical protein